MRRKPTFWKDEWGWLHMRWVMALMAVAAVVLVGGGWGLDIAIQRGACNEAGERLGQETEWRFLTGCYVELDGQMVPYNAQQWNRVTIQGEGK